MGDDREQLPDLPQLGLQDALMMMQDEETELDKVLKLLLDDKNIHHNTELSGKDITAFSVLASITKLRKLPVLENFLYENLKLRVSKGRKGRAEWVKITSRSLVRADEAEAAQRRFGGMLARRRR